MERVVRFGGGLMVMLSELRRLRLVDGQRRGARGKQMALPWEAVTDTSWRLARSVLLVRDIMDALVLDVVERHAMRANDLDAAVGQVAPVTWRHNAPRLFS